MHLSIIIVDLGITLLGLIALFRGFNSLLRKEIDFLGKKRIGSEAILPSLFLIVLGLIFVLGIIIF